MSHNLCTPVWVRKKRLNKVQGKEYVLIAYSPTMLAESSIIPRAVLYFRLGINVKILAFLVATFP